jgi:hypothetical protein
MDNDIKALLEEALDCYKNMNDSEKLRMWYEQKRSFARGMCSDSANYVEHYEQIDKLMPHESELTDAQIGLVLVGQYHGK